ncbi:MAG: hypothetical protein DMF77_01680 [Acidobacteria bacterium]|nr:MAG: hypothetical protein DMF77_01680 [Acidobacteriota bacterium]
MKAFAYAERWGHEEIVLVRDVRSGLRAIIALHDTTLGPAIGGTRMRVYPSEDDALLDALRLARAMTYKCAMAEMRYGTRGWSSGWGDVSTPAPTWAWTSATSRSCPA